MRKDKSSNNDAADDGEATISKSQRKRDMHELQGLGERLVELNKKQLDALPLPEELLDAVRDTRNVGKHEARRRHMQYIGRLMRNVDAEPIREKLREWDGQSREATAEQHQLERWRERLIEDEGALAEYLADHPAAVRDAQHLRTLIRNAREERALGKPLRHYRELFRELRRIADNAPGES